jgi:hypothetical protein
VSAVPADSFILVNGDDAVERALIASGQFREMKQILEADGTVPFARLEKRTRP